MSLRPGSISAYILTVILTVVTGILLLFGCAAFLKERSHLYSTLDRNLTIVSDRLAGGLAVPVWNLDESQVGKLLDDFMKDREIAAITLEAGGRRYERGRSAGLKVVERAAPLPMDEIVVQHRKVVSAGREIGSLSVAMTRHYVHGELTRSAVGIFLAILVIDAVICLVLYLILSRHLLQPLQMLDSFAESVKTTPDACPVLGERRFLGELETLRLSLIEMVEVLNSRYREKIEAEAQLQRHRNMLKKVLDTIPQAVFWKDRDCIYLGCNRQFAHDAGIADPESVVGASDFQLPWPPEDARAYQEDDRHVMESNSTRMHIIEPLVKADGTRRWIDTSKTPLLDDDGTVYGVLGVYDDITRRKQLEEELRQSQKMEAVGQLAGGVAHDFNNILTVIAGYCALLQLDSNLSARHQEQLAEIAASTEKAAQLTHRLLAFSRKQPLVMRHKNFNDIILEVHKFLARIIGEDITLKTSCCGAELPIFADQGQLEQVLINLATNARDAMLTGGTFTVTSQPVTIDETFTDHHNYQVPPGRYALLTVADTGSGIGKEHLDHIFEPFFTTKEVGKGTGLGLSIIYGIIKQHNGFIHVYSEVGQGTTFRIYLPIREAGELPQPLQRVAAPPKGGNETILVAEDDPTVRSLVASILEGHGYRTVLAEDGEDAIAKFRDNLERVDLVLMDVIMPRRNGKEAFEEIKRLRPGTKALFTSGYTADFIESRGVSEEGIELIMKPVHPMEVLRRVREMLDR